MKPHRMFQTLVMTGVLIAGCSPPAESDDATPDGNDTDASDTDDPPTDDTDVALPTGDTAECCPAACADTPCECVDGNCCWLVVDERCDNLCPE